MDRKAPLDMTQQPSQTITRIIGEYGDAANGPLMIVVAGLHGNEPAGLVAARRVLDVLASRSMKLQGRLLALAGNLKAIERRERFIDSDLNRMWNTESVIRARNSAPGRDGVEGSELRELLKVFDDELDSHKRPVFLVDLHSTSADSAPFCIMSDTLQNRRVGLALGIPVILGLEEAIDGTIQGFFAERGFVTLAIEGGRHDGPATADRIESALWVMMRAAGLLEDGALPELSTHKSRLRQVSNGLPAVVEVFYRHGLEPGDEFRMCNGFQNFSPVRSGERVARDSRGDIQVPDDGLLILPSYQGAGDDGFFVGRRVRHFWLALSAGLRRLRVDRLVHLLPGVRRDPVDERILYADPRVTRWFTRQIFHLTGFRRCPSTNGLLVFKRRVEG